MDSAPALVSILISDTPIMLLSKPVVSRNSPFDPVGVKFAVNAPDAVPYVIEGSSDLATWAPVETFNQAAGTVSFVDSAALQHLFFRAKTKP